MKIGLRENMEHRHILFQYLGHKPDQASFLSQIGKILQQFGTDTSVLICILDRKGNFGKVGIFIKIISAKTNYFLFGILHDNCLNGYFFSIIHHHELLESFMGHVSPGRNEPPEHGLR